MNIFSFFFLKKRNRMDFDPSRPCGTLKRGSKEKYSREELDALAAASGIKEYSTMDMNTLCGILQIKHTKQGTVVPRKPPPCFLESRRLCEKKKSTSTKTPYTIHELRTLWKKECKDLPEFKLEKPKTKEDYCKLMKGRYLGLKSVLPNTVPEKVFTTLKTWWKKKKTTKVPDTSSRLLHYSRLNVSHKNAVDTIQ
jgi:hypothetical protein